MFTNREFKSETPPPYMCYFNEGIQTVLHSFNSTSIINILTPNVQYSSAVLSLARELAGNWGHWD